MMTMTTTTKTKEQQRKSEKATKKHIHHVGRVAVAVVESPVTGHENPFIIRVCLERFDFDTVLLPLNPAESQSPSFLEHVVPLAREKGMGIIGMKVYLHGFASRIPGYTEMEPFLRYALTQPLSTVVIGCDDLLQMEENVRYAAAFEPMTAEELQDLEGFVAPHARQLMYYRP